MGEGRLARIAGRRSRCSSALSFRNDLMEISAAQVLRGQLVGGDVVGCPGAAELAGEQLGGAVGGVAAPGR
jgi:hypothetical protein